MQAYRTLEKRFARISDVESALGILNWDNDTIMPAGAAGQRAGQVATLSVIAHELMTGPDMPDLLQDASAAGDGLDAWQRANLAEMRRLHAHSSAVPADLVDAASRANSACERAWREARANSDFKALLPLLQEVLLRQRDVAQAKGAALGLAPYDALLDLYDPGNRMALIDPVFRDLAAGLPALLGQVLEHQSALPAPLPLQGPFPVELQTRLAARLMRAVGFDTGRGRLDTSTHPFCGGGNDDVRITTRYDEADFGSSLMGVLHETGHALYEQGRPREWLAQPAGRARGMTMHESQSLLIEMQACRSREFVEFLAPLVREAFDREGPEWQADNLHRRLTRVSPGFIRVDADEVTYPAHVLVRYRLETALIAGDLALADLPGAFDAGIRDLLGIVVPDDRRGCLQDIHWPAGLWGYFPTYTLGAITAAQLFEAARRAKPEIPARLVQGDFRPLLDWLRPNVHERGSSVGTAEIVRDATGFDLTASIYQRHLRRRYLDAA
ncbi:carboxypeptidase M32 [Lichenicoccus roseus]|uniref:Metal-dependent carboxypeptidase n=1 Tax=Lichenicoccus roseus TaxID=2683649 RepID=A0A5R9JE94_9PROT|nr:carboxypeptidase M32 [Lichenicoccus roseus]TLU73726.1 carboxypeptidase M32 [Lichenicoccus roseus]